MLGLENFLDPGSPVREPFNLWALRKNPRIKGLLLLLSSRLGTEGWIVDLASRTSADAVYLMHPSDCDLRAYLHVHGQAAGRAGLYLEYPGVDAGDPVYATYDDLGMNRLADMLAAHFGICPPGAA